MAGVEHHVAVEVVTDQQPETSATATIPWPEPIEVTLEPGMTAATTTPIEVPRQGVYVFRMVGDGWGEPGQSATELTACANYSLERGGGIGCSGDGLVVTSAPAGDPRGLVTIVGSEPVYLVATSAGDTPLPGDDEIVTQQGVRAVIVEDRRPIATLTVSSREQFAAWSRLTPGVEVRGDGFEPGSVTFFQCELVEAWRIDTESCVSLESTKADFAGEVTATVELPTTPVAQDRAQVVVVAVQNNTIAIPVTVWRGGPKLLRVRPVSIDDRLPARYRVRVTDLLAGEVATLDVCPTGMEACEDPVRSYSLTGSGTGRDEIDVATMSGEQVVLRVAGVDLGPISGTTPPG